MHAGLLKTLKKVRENLLYSVVLTHFEKKVTSVTVGFSFFFLSLKKKSLLLNQGRLDKCTVQGYSLKKNNHCNKEIL